MKAFYTLLLLVLVWNGCQTDFTKDAVSRTDYVPGQVYELQKAAWIFNGSLMSLRAKEPSQSEGLLTPGTKLAVRNVVVFRSPELGTFAEVFAEVLTGNCKGWVVNVSRISDQTQTGYTKRDPMMLVPVESEALNASGQPSHE